ncbi:hypothetical protein [Moorena sp. SIO3I6]|uniref:hypothetical protein n=1 Tax=Moorena sp. SIO3I6 TaxID=2607831 RepID=UPI0013FCE342|nr:hypothetical protein [Moorena sp. SIO3I6]NEP25566.1 hypothetical protein [Moorena sp. SIO3I6]
MRLTICDRIPEDSYMRSHSQLPIPDFLTIPVLTDSLIVDTTALDLPPTLSTLTTL